MATPQLATEPSQAAQPATTCDAVFRYNDLEVTPSHGKVFYIDTGQGQNINAAYVGYKVDSNSVDKNDIWIQLSGFDSEEVVQLANPADANMQVGDLAAGNSHSGVAYFLLTANQPATSPQTHTVKVFSGSPTKVGNLPLYECSYTFAKVQETIKAAANKVIDVSATSATAIGGELIITHEGATGTIGAGSSPDGDVIWLSPASNSSWPTRALRLKSVSVEYFGNKTLGNSLGVKNNELILKPARSTFPKGGGFDVPGSYRAVYTFDIIGRGAAAIAPVAQISSGTQIKHTDMSGYYTNGVANASFDTTSTPVSLEVTKNAGSIAASGNSTNIVYTVQVKNTGAGTVEVEKVVDIADENLTITSATVEVAPSSAAPGAGTAFGDYFAGTAASGSRDWTFSGPFSIGTGQTLNIVYTSSVTCTSGISTYGNYAVAYIGDTVAGASATQYQNVNVSLSQNTDGTSCTLVSSDVVRTNQTFSIDAQTGPASNLATSSGSSSATIGGTVDSNSVAGENITCEFSTDSTLAGSTSVAASSPAGGLTTSSQDPVNVSCSLTSLSPGTTYYYRVNAGAASGQILSFTTPPNVLPAPVVTTTSVSNVTTTTASLNGTVNPGGNLTRVQFEIKDMGTSLPANCPAASDTSATVIANVDFDPDTSTYAALDLSGGFETQVSHPRTGLSNNTYYCYRITGTANNATVKGDWTLFRASSINPPVADTFAATSVTQNSATLNGQVTAGTSPANVTFCFGSDLTSLANCIAPFPATPGQVGSGTLSVSVDQSSLSPNSTYYFRVVATDSTDSGIVSLGPIKSFTTLAPPTATTVAASSVEDTIATINGTVDANGSSTRVYFCLSTASDSTAGILDDCQNASAFNASGTGVLDPDGSISVAGSFNGSKFLGLQGLQPTTQYWFQIVAVNANGTAVGSILDFTTTALTSVATTTTVDVDPSEITGESAKLKGNLNPNGASTDAEFCYRKAAVPNENPANDSNFCDTLPSGQRIPVGSGLTGGNQPVDVTLTSLEPNSEYIYMLRTQNNKGKGHGGIKRFSTSAVPPVPLTNPATNVTGTSADISGTVNPRNKEAQIRFCWGTDPTLGTCTRVTPGNNQDRGNGNSPVASSFSLTDLTPGTPYYFRIIGNNGVGGLSSLSVSPQSFGSFSTFSSYSTGTKSSADFVILSSKALNDVEGNIESFVTLSTVTATTDQPTSVTDVGATLNGTVTAGTDTATVSFCFGQDSTLTTCDQTVTASPATVTGTGSVTASVSSLSPSTTYYYRVDAVGTNNTGSGSVVSFTTSATAPATQAPTATTVAASSVTQTTAVLNGTVTAGNLSTTVTFCYGTDSALSTCIAVPAATQSPVSGSASTPVSVTVSGLTAGTLYYFEVRASNTSGNATGSILSFTTQSASVTPTPTLAAVTTAASSVTATTATLNGSVNPGGESTTVSFCFGTDSGLAGCQSVAAAQSPLTGSTASNVSVAVSGLTPNTTYYFRVTGTNAGQGTANGAILSFTTSAAPAETDPCEPVAAESVDEAYVELGLIGVLGELATGALDLASAGAEALYHFAMQSPMVRALVDNQVAMMNLGIDPDTYFTIVNDSAVFETLAKASPKAPTTEEQLDPTDIVIEPGTEPNSVTVTSSTGQALELVSVASIDLNLYAAFTGAELNNPVVWQNLGYGLQCWKLEPFSDTWFYLPESANPPGVTSGNWRYSNIIVKAGSITADPTTFQANTLFPNARGGDMVWADVNGNGIYDPGGKSGDKAISHIVLCADLITDASQEPIPSETPTEEPTATGEPAPSETPTEEPSQSAEPTPSESATETPTVEPTPSEEPTVTPEPSPTATTPAPAPTESGPVEQPEPTQQACSTPTVAPSSPAPEPKILIFSSPKPSGTPTPTEPGEPTDSPEPTDPAPSEPGDPSPEESENPVPSPSESPSPEESDPAEPAPTDSPSPEEPGSTPAPEAPETGTPAPTPTDRPAVIPQAVFDPTPPEVCTPSSQFGVAMTLTNGRTTTCFRMTSESFLAIASFGGLSIPESAQDEEVTSEEGSAEESTGDNPSTGDSGDNDGSLDASGPDELADTGFETSHWLVVAMLMLAAGSSLLVYARRRA